MKRFIKLTLVLVCGVILSSCVFHDRHHGGEYYGGPHDSHMRHDSRDFRDSRDSRMNQPNDLRSQPNQPRRY